METVFHRHEKSINSYLWTQSKCWMIWIKRKGSYVASCRREWKDYPIKVDQQMSFTIALRYIAFKFFRHQKLYTIKLVIQRCLCSPSVGGGLSLAIPWTWISLVMFTDYNVQTESWGSWHFKFISALSDIIISGAQIPYSDKEVTNQEMGIWGRGENGFY